jgi:hypothetical protein
MLNLFFKEKKKAYVQMYVVGGLKTGFTKFPE